MQASEGSEHVSGRGQSNEKRCHGASALTNCNPASAGAKSETSSLTAGLSDSTQLLWSKALGGQPASGNYCHGIGLSSSCHVGRRWIEPSSSRRLLGSSNDQRLAAAAPHQYALNTVLNIFSFIFIDIISAFSLYVPHNDDASSHFLTTPLFLTTGPDYPPGTLSDVFK